MQFAAASRLSDLYFAVEEPCSTRHTPNSRRTKRQSKKDEKAEQEIELG
jgi:hypothetical protein